MGFSSHGIKTLYPNRGPDHSRYKGTQVVSDGDYKKLQVGSSRFAPFRHVNREFVEAPITTAEQARLDLVSGEYFETGVYWWVIGRASGIFNPFELSAGDVVKIPTMIHIGKRLGRKK